MKTLYMTKGLPASGKTTTAKALVATQLGTKRVNKDDLRAMIDGGKWSEANEKFIIEARNGLLYSALGGGFHAIPPQVVWTRSTLRRWSGNVKPGANGGNGPTQSGSCRGV